MSDSIELENIALHRVAHALGVPVESFTSGEHNERHQGACECLSLWHEIATADGRWRALEALRRIAAEEPNAVNGTSQSA